MLHPAGTPRHTPQVTSDRPTDDTAEWPRWSEDTSPASGDTLGQRIPEADWEGGGSPGVRRPWVGGGVSASTV